MDLFDAIGMGGNDGGDRPVWDAAELTEDWDFTLEASYVDSGPFGGNGDCAPLDKETGFVDEPKTQVGDRGEFDGCPESDLNAGTVRVKEFDFDSRSETPNTGGNYKPTADSPWKNGDMRDFFSPLALESLFAPPIATSTPTTERLQPEKPRVNDTEDIFNLRDTFSRKGARRTGITDLASLINQVEAAVGVTKPEEDEKAEIFVKVLGASEDADQLGNLPEPQHEYPADIDVLSELSEPVDELSPPVDIPCKEVAKNSALASSLGSNKSQAKMGMIRNLNALSAKTPVAVINKAAEESNMIYNLQTHRWERKDSAFELSLSDKPSEEQMKNLNASLPPPPGLSYAKSTVSSHASSAQSLKSQQTGHSSSSGMSSKRRMNIQDFDFKGPSVISPHSSPLPRRVGDMVFDQVNKRWTHVDREKEEGLEINDDELKKSPIKPDEKAGSSRSATRKYGHAKRDSIDKGIQVGLSESDRRPSLQKPVSEAEVSAKIVDVSIAQTSVLQEMTLANLDMAMTDLADLQASFILQGPLGEKSLFGCQSEYVNTPGNTSILGGRSLAGGRSILMGRSFLNEATLGGLENAFKSLAHFDDTRIDMTRADDDGVSMLHSLDLDEPQTISPEPMPLQLSKERLLIMLRDKLDSPGDCAFLDRVDLSNCLLESLQGLDVLTPDLKELIVNDNKLAFVSGVPESIMSLSIIANQLSDMTCFGAMRNLQYLDISRNNLKDISSISNLQHLRELVADQNEIESCGPLRTMSGLLKLSLRQNRIRSLDFSSSRLLRLEWLDLSENQIVDLMDIESLKNVKVLYLGNNSISRISLGEPLYSLKELDMEGNFLELFDGQCFPNLEVLNLDGNQIGSFVNEASLGRLKKLSINEQQQIQVLNIDFHHLANLSELHLAGTPFDDLNTLNDNYKLEVLDCRSCHLETLPKDFAKSMTGLRILDLTNNRIISVEHVKYLDKLNAISIASNRLDDYGVSLSALKTCKLLEEVDLRDNLITSKFYPPDDDDFAEIDVAYTRNLSDKAFVKRAIYRSVLINALRRSIRLLDGLFVSDKDVRRSSKTVKRLRALRKTNKAVVGTVQDTGTKSVEKRKSQNPFDPSSPMPESSAVSSQSLGDRVSLGTFPSPVEKSRKLAKPDFWASVKEEEKTVGVSPERASGLPRMVTQNALFDICKGEHEAAASALRSRNIETIEKRWEPVQYPLNEDLSGFYIDIGDASRQA